MRKPITAIAGYDDDDPTVVAATLDADEYHRLISRLVRAREAAGLRQRDVAERMGTSQSAVSEIERAGSDPRVSTLMRYATAVGAPIRTRNNEIRGLRRAVGSISGTLPANQGHAAAGIGLRKDAWRSIGSTRRSSDTSQTG